MFEALLTVTYSLNVKVKVVPCTGTFTDMCLGEKATIVGGIVSLAPPEGAWVVLAHECENNIDPRTRATGTAGTSRVSNLLQFIIYRS